MSSTLESALTSLQQNNYVSLIILTALVYDYVLTFSNEIEYIWTKPWSWVSTSFVLVRYAGIFSLAIDCLSTSFVPGPVETYVFVLLSPFLELYLHLLNSCEIIYITSEWIFMPFLAAADCELHFVMILRVWAMYNRSKIILGCVLPLFAMEIISLLVANIIYGNPKKLLAATTQILNLSFCSVQDPSPIVTEVSSIIQLAHAVVLCILAVAQSVKQSLQVHRVTKQWQISRYTNLLVKQGILYFIAISLTNILNMYNLLGNFPTQGWGMMVLYILEYLPLFTLTPRFILSIRELYARNVHGTRSGGIDTGFGLSSSGRGGVGTTMVFADVEQNEESEEAEETAMEEG